MATVAWFVYTNMQPKVAPADTATMEMTPETTTGQETAEAAPKTTPWVSGYSLTPRDNAKMTPTKATEKTAANSAADPVKLPK